MFYQFFFSPKVKRWAITTYKHAIYKLPHELPNDLSLKDLRKLGNIGKLSNCLNFHAQDLMKKDKFGELLSPF